MSKESFFDKLVGGKDKDGPNEDETPEQDAFEQEPQVILAAKSSGAAKIKTRQTAPMPQEDNWGEDEGQLTLDVYQTSTEIVIKSAMAGVNPGDIDIAINNDMVTVRGHRQKEEEAETKDYYYQELYWGSFSRSVILPVEVDADEATATYKNGVLTIRLPKLDRNKNKKVRVKLE